MEPFVATILVCGGRNYSDRRRITEVLREYLPEDHNDGTPTVVHGDARGADRTAADVAMRLGFWVEAYPANWVRHGKAAGPIRNERMAMRVSERRGGGSLCIAFPGGTGTQDMVRRAERWGVPIRSVNA